MFCPDCGKQLNDNVKFCSGCGNPVKEAPAIVEAVKVLDEQQAKKQLGRPKARWRIATIFLSIALCVVLVAASVLLLLRPANTGTDNIDANQTGESAESIEATNNTEADWQEAPEVRAEYPNNISQANQRIEGRGFESPQEAVAAYLDAFSRANFSDMISTFAIESFVENYNLLEQLERIRVYSFFTATQRFPSNAQFLREINETNRQWNVADRISHQFVYLFLSDSITVLYSMPFLNGNQKIVDFIAAMDNPQNFEILSTLHLIEFVDPGDMSEHFSSSHNQELISRQMRIYGAQGNENVVARVEIYDQILLFFFCTVKHNGRWFINDLGGNIGIMMGVSFSNGGVALERDIDFTI